MTDMLRGLGGWWFWIPALAGVVVWGLFAATWWRYGLLIAVLVTFGGIGAMVVGACVALVLLFVFDSHEPYCVYAGCRKRAPLQLRGKPYRQPFCPEHAVELAPIPPPRGIETHVLEVPDLVDGSGTRSGPR